MSSREAWVEVDGGTIWYRVVGSGGGAPLFLCHGGPGLSHDYFEPLEALGDDRPVVFYDQLGSGKSGGPDDTSLWRLDRYVDELTRLVAAIGSPRHHVLGHSWGSTLALEYALGRPLGLSGLILASPVISADAWRADAARLMAAMPADVRDTIAAHEAAGTTDSEEYQGAQMAYYRTYLIRSPELPDALMRSIGANNEEIYTHMWGLNEFNLTGTLAAHERAARLGELTVPVLYTCGRFDEATPESTARFAAATPGASVRVFERSAHLAFLEESDAYVRAVREFLRGADAA